MALRIIPIVLFLLLIGFFSMRLMQIEEDPNSGKDIPSPLIGKAAPDFTLPQLYDPNKTFSKSDLLGKITLVSVWASWCPECVRENPLLLELKRLGIIDLYSINYKDDRGDAIRWMRRFGDPYIAIGHDEKGTVGMNWGVYGAPESFVVDQQGVIRDKYIGSISVEDVKERLMPLIEKLKQGSDS